MSMNPGSSSLIVFDFGGVLMRHNRAGCMQALQQLMTDEAITDILGFGNERQDTLRYLFETGRLSAEQFISKVLSFCHPGTTQQQFIDAWNTIHAGIDERTWAQLESLRKKGCRLHLLSNTDAIHWQHTLALYHEQIERLFDSVFLSFQQGLVKPDPAFFEVVHQHVATPDCEIVFVDDMEVNRLAAQHSVGWRTLASVDDL